MRYIALLRGINVGGKNRVAMTALAELCRDAGARDVETYIQSGNVVFEAAQAVVRALPERVRAAFGVPIVVRTADELRAAIRRQPFRADTAELHLGFLASAPTRDAVAALDPGRSPPDEFVVRGREVYLRCPKGMGNSKLTCAYFDSRLATTMTVRNWNTVLALRDLI